MIHAFAANRPRSRIAHAFRRLGLVLVLAALAFQGTGTPTQPGMALAERAFPIACSSDQGEAPANTAPGAAHDGNCLVCLSSFWTGASLIGAEAGLALAPLPHGTIRQPFIAAAGLFPAQDHPSLPRAPPLA